MWHDDDRPTPPRNPRGEALYLIAMALIITLGLIANLIG